jgi:hypothetical protein
MPKNKRFPMDNKIKVGDMILYGKQYGVVILEKPNHWFQVLWFNNPEEEWWYSLKDISSFFKKVS